MQDFLQKQVSKNEILQLNQFTTIFVVKQLKNKQLKFTNNQI